MNFAMPSPCRSDLSRPGKLAVVLLVALGGIGIGMSNSIDDGDRASAGGGIGSAALHRVSSVVPNGGGIATSPNAAPSAPAVRLLGVAIWRANDPAAALALLESGGSSALFAVGDQLGGGFRLARIDADRVLVEGTGGAITIHLQSTALRADVPVALAARGLTPAQTLLPATTPLAHGVAIDESRLDLAPESNSD